MASLHSAAPGRCALRGALATSKARNVSGARLQAQLLRSTNDAKSDKAISALDSLLGSSDDGDKAPQQGRDPNLVEWWRVKPRQSAPPRTTAISEVNSRGGRFINNEEFLRNEIWVGRKTVVGQAIELPKVSPFVCYLLAVANVAAYGTLVRVAVGQGEGAAAELLSAVGLNTAAVAEQGELWRLLSACVVHADFVPLALTLYGLAAVAPRVEASLGHRTFLAAVLLSAAASADAIVALGSYAPVASSATTAISTASSALPEGTNLLSALLNPTAAAAGAQAAGAWEAVAASTAANLAMGAAATMMGLVGCCVAHQLVNGDVEKRASESGVAAAGGQGPGGQRTEGGWWSRYVAAEGVLAGVALQLAATTAGGVGVAATAAALGAGFSAGFLLAYTAGPRYQVTHEVDIPDGALWIPDPEAVNEMVVVLDQTTAGQRSLATGAMAAAVGLASLAVAFAGH